MEINVKYKLYQTVWYNDVPKPKSMSLKALRILCFYSGYSGDNWGDTNSRGGGWPFRIQYSHEGNPKDDQWVSQELLFPSLEELVKHLSEK